MRTIFLALIFSLAFNFSFAQNEKDRGIPSGFTSYEQVLQVQLPFTKSKKIKAAAKVLNNYLGKYAIVEHVPSSTINSRYVLNISKGNDIYYARIIDRSGTDFLPDLAQHADLDTLLQQAVEKLNYMLR